MKEVDIQLTEKEVIVFQMGKVASTAITRSVGESGIKASQPHFLSMDAFLTLIKKFEDPDLLPFTANHTLGQIYTNIPLHNKIQKQKKYGYKDKYGSNLLKIITIAREPVGWYLSNLSQNFEEYKNQILGWSDPDFADGKDAQVIENKITIFLNAVFNFFAKTVERIDESTLPQLFKYLDPKNSEYQKGNEAIVQHCLMLMRPIVWFSQHFDPIIGTNFKTMHFDRQRGYAIIQQDALDILFLRFEDLRKCGNSVIGSFLGIDSFQMVEDNVTQNKKIGALVMRAVQHVHFPESFLEKIYDNAYADKFYGPEITTVLKNKYKASS